MHKTVRQKTAEKYKNQQICKSPVASFREKINIASIPPHQSEINKYRPTYRVSKRKRIEMLTH